ncbi:uncharacterized protein [Temnothorax longispinosus]|uniref:uncharacterized protein n=1 Tax=Temnothorax longispinosus TaxID=300112 RepID=UPI003A98E683
MSNLEMEGLIRSQNELHGRIARAYENLKKAGGARLTMGLVDARLQALESNWNKFEEQHGKLLLMPPEVLAATDYKKQDLPALVEETFLTQKGMFLDVLLSHKAREEAAAKSETSETATTTNRTTLPRIQLPEFSGKYEDWPSFRDLFHSLIGRDANTTPVEKLHYLKTSLKGEAELLVRNIATTAENYNSAWDVLNAYYENKRLLTRAYLSNFLALTKMKSESAVELRKIFHGVKATVSSLASIGRPINRSEDLFVYLAVELLDPRSRREWETSIGDTTEPPTYATLEQFLDRQLHTLESMQPAKVDGAAGKAASGAAKSARSHLARKQEGNPDAKRGRCHCCQKDHILMFCEDYKRKTAQERKQLVDSKNLCLNCLGSHKVSECASKKGCAACGARHHTSVHDACREVEVAKTVHAAQRLAVKPSAVLLATARVRVADRFGTLHHARALVDQGSESSLVTERLAQRLKLPRSRTSVSIFGVGGQKTAVAKGRVSLTLAPRTDGPAMSVSALVLPRLTIYAGGVEAGADAWTHLRGLELADPEFSASDSVDILLVADVYAEILQEGLRKGGSREPVAQNTTLGWILSGAIGEGASSHFAQSYQCRVEDELSQLVRRFWEQEEVPSAAGPLSKADQECEEHFARTHSRKPDGRYVVRLPVVEPMPNLSGTRRAAVRVMKAMEAKFARDAPFHALYTDFMRQYVELGHMTPVDPPADPAKLAVCYLPHHGVMKETSATTKLRVVFNGSSALPTGAALNKYLQTGPNLLPALAEILLRWRRHRYVFAADIEKMYRQIEVHPEDRDLQRIVWRESPSDVLLEFLLITLTYGLACSAFLAIRTLHQLAKDEGVEFPLGAIALLLETYMDDVLSGADTISRAKEIRRQLDRICMAGGFPLKKWSANEASILDEVPPEDRLQREPRWWLPGESHLTLGLRWHPREDQFAYSTQLTQLEAITKRSVLSLAARLFDPLGWLAPTTVLAKILFQSTWLLGLDWDTQLPDTDVRRWLEFQAGLPLLETIRVPRWLESDQEGVKRELHGFADASEKAYAAVVYLRTESSSGEVVVSLVTAKTKVAPLKQVSLARLELNAAALLVRLANHARRVLKIEEDPTHLWTDATVVLGWIRGHPASWKTYVANRVSEIQLTLPDAYWHHVPGRENPADCASRGLLPRELVEHPLWWQGPAWLRTKTGPWSAPLDDEVPVDLPERRSHIHAVAAATEEPELLTRYSSLTSLARTTAWCRRWLRCLRARRTAHEEQPDASAGLILTREELNDAIVGWIGLVQSTHFKGEATALRKNAPLLARSSIASLSPFLDERGLLRVGGRLKNAMLAYDARHPVILPGPSRLTRLIVEACHRRTLHGGVQTTLGALRQEYWVPRGRTLVKGCIRRCVTCVRWRAASPQPLMGSLPGPRVTPARPFLNTGVDYAGPVWLRTSKGRGQRASKAFIVVFVCLCSRAVHLDVATDYTADAFLAALRRFVSRRGLCQTLYSDRGTNFVGADAQLRDLFSAGGQGGRRIAERVAEERIAWRFNPPAAPNFGGIWEAAVKSTKHHLRRVIGEATLTYEEMATLLSQVEACLNSRPLQALTDDPEDLSPLTPGHFLIGSAISAVPEPSLTEERTTRLSRWQQVQQMRDHFWARWSKEYLQTLAHRPKWLKADLEVRAGRLCLVRSETTPPTKWPLARIEELLPGDDGQVRVVKVRTAASILTRPVSKLVLLPDCDAPGSEE